jgi:hypothetical protein
VSPSLASELDLNSVKRLQMQHFLAQALARSFILRTAMRKKA